jgi:hypothetical protein
MSPTWQCCKNNYFNCHWNSLNTSAVNQCLFGIEREKIVEEASFT